MLTLNQKITQIIENHRKNANLVVISKSGFNNHENDIVVSNYSFAKLT